MDHSAMRAEMRTCVVAPKRTTRGKEKKGGRGKGGGGQRGRGGGRKGKGGGSGGGGGGRREERCIRISALPWRCV
eukprot:8232325-Pyramimonas_sp.AAC.1